VVVTDDFLRHLPLFADLSDAQRARVLAAAEVVRVPAGAWLFQAGDPGDALYVVRHGRLEVVQGDTVIRVLGSGAALGELALLAEGVRSASVRARRETEVLRVSREQFAELLAGDAAFAVALTRTLADQLQRTSVAPAPPAPTATVITVLALHPSMADAAARVARALAARLSAQGDDVELLRGDEVQADAGEYGRVLDRCECDFDHVVLATSGGEGGDGDDGLWDDFCLRQADRVVGVVDPTAVSPGPGVTSAVTDLVAYTPVVRSAAITPWLDALAPSAHHHVDPGRGFEEGMARLARRLAGRSVGVVLSGGGARGLAHIGALAALREAGVEVDRFGGTSMGSFVAGLAALGLTPAEMLAVCREELVLRKPFNDYTVPRHSLIKAHKAGAMLARVFGDRRAEELDSPFFSVSADLLSGTEVVHRRGPLAVAVGVSMSLPGLVPPVAHAERVLVDGGVLNNLPVDVMAAAGEGPIIAVDVMRRPGGGRDGAGLPSLVDTLARSTVLGSWRRAEANRALAALVVSPELADVGLLEFRRLESIVERGRAAAEAALAAAAPSSAVWSK